MLAMAKIFEVLFNLPGIVISVRYVSSTPVAQHAGLNSQLRR